jgi:hypothetical protein
VAKGNPTPLMSVIACDVSPEEAKVVWESMKAPSDPKVCAAFRQAGRIVSPSSIRTWRLNEWKRKDDGLISKMQHKLDELEKMVSVLTKNPQSKLADVQPFDTTMPGLNGTRAGQLPTALAVRAHHDARSLVELVDQMSDLELMSEANRRAHGICMGLFGEIDRQKTLLLADGIDGLSNLMKALGTFLEAANVGAKHCLDVQERKMLVVNPDGRRGRGELDADVADEVDVFQKMKAASSAPVIIDATPARPPLQS